MPASQVVFTGVPAFVANVVGATRVKFSIDETDFDPARVIDVDLAKNPSTVDPGQWGAGVDCDQQTGDGLTTIGPRFHGGVHVGAVYLAQRLVTQYQSVLANWPPAPDDLYQYQLVVRSNNGTESRFHGFKVRVLGGGSGSIVRVAFIRTGSAAPGPGGRRWIDLADPDVCDPKANGFTTIEPSSPPGTDGALFVSAATTRDGGGDNFPKIPKALGW